MPLIQELIDVPEQAYRGDFVLRMTNAEATLESYVVTPQLVSCFDDALALIRRTLRRGGRARHD